MSVTLELCRRYLGKEVHVIIDRPIGSRHPTHGFLYTVNYGYIPGTQAPDGDPLDAYYLGVNEPIEEAPGLCRAIVHRLDDDDDKLVVMQKEVDLSEEEIETLVNFQEQWFKHEILRK